MPRPGALLFDIGSTLWSSPAEDLGALAHCYGRGREILIEEGLRAPPIDALIQAVEGYFAEWEDIWRAETGRVEQPPTTNYVKTALAKIGVEPPSGLLAAFTNAILETSVLTAMVEPAEPEMPIAMKRLSDLGLRLACVSNAFMPGAVLQRILDERGLGAYCEFSVSSCELGIRKPDKRIYAEALRVLGLPGERVVFVGDRMDADIEGPAGLGMGTVLSHQYRQEDPARGRRGPDHVIRHLSDLVPYIEGLVRGS